MGSRIMHLIVGNEVSKKLAIQNRNLFLLGSIAADATTDKAKTHFFTGDLNQYSRQVDYGAFIKKYNHQKENEFVLGYYSHLITDDLWLSGFYVPWLRNQIGDNPEMQELYHKDFKFLNSKLLNKYQVNQELDALFDPPKRIDIVEEVDEGDIIKFTECIKDDFIYTDEELDEPLKVFTHSQIIGYIETAIEKSVHHIKEELS